MKKVAYGQIKLLNTGLHKPSFHIILLQDLLEFLLILTCNYDSPID